MEKQRPNPYPIRLTPELKEKLTESAKKNGRSLNAEMLLRLDNSFDTSERERVEKIVADVLQKMEDEGTISINK